MMKSVWKLYGNGHLINQNQNQTVVDGLKLTKVYVFTACIIEPLCRWSMYSVPAFIFIFLFFLVFLSYQIQINMYKHSFVGIKNAIASTIWKLFTMIHIIEIFLLFCNQSRNTPIIHLLSPIIRKSQQNMDTAAVVTSYGMILWPDLSI